MKKIIIIIIFLITTSSYPVQLYSNGIQDITFQWTNNNINFDTDLSSAINISDKIKFIMTLSNAASSTDTATVDIGTSFPDIELYNNGSHGDTISNDNIFTVIWTVKEGLSIINAPIKGNFWDGSILKSISGLISLSFDGVRPVVNNISASPNAFNPYIHNCEIVYSMTETVSSVAVNIYNELSMTNLVKELPKPPLESGDNFITWWDGKNQSGSFARTPPDDDYYISIICRDGSGNYSSPATASVKISTVKIEIVSLDITPTPVSPDGDGVNDNIYVNTKMLLYSWDGITRSGINTNQMLNLDFTAGSNWSGNPFFANGNLFVFWPNAKIGFNIYTAGGQKIKEFGQDLDPTSDHDQNYINRYSSMIPPAIKPDGDPDNDWDTLTVFYDDGTAGHEFDYSGGGLQRWDGIFTASESFLIKLTGEWDNGVYIVKTEAELVGITYEPHLNGIHFIPVWKGGYISTKQPVQATFTVDINGVDPIDFTPPTILAVYPEDNSKIVYGLPAVSVILDDGPGGSGIDLANSDIYLTDILGNKIPGSLNNNGVDTISWQLDSTLKKNGVYYIYITPVDKRGNQPDIPYKYSFILEVKDDNLNLITVKGGGNVVDNDGTLYMAIPPYAVEKDMRITVHRPLFYPGNYQISSGYQFIPASLSFKRPVKLILHYNDIDRANLPPGADETDLRIYNWQTDKWVYLGGTVDKDKMTVTVEGIRDARGYFAVLPKTVGGLPDEVISDVQVDKPFKKGGYISFKLSSPVTALILKIYDMSGYFIKEISPNINSFNNAGYYDLKWDLTANNGDLMKNGIYIFRFIAEKTDGTKKVVSKAIPVIK